MNYAYVIAEDGNAPELRLDLRDSWARRIKTGKSDRKRISREEKRAQKLEVIWQEMEEGRHDWRLMPRSTPNPA